MPLANPKTDAFKSMRVECTTLIGEGLSKHITKHILSTSIIRPSKITDPDPISTNYVNYDMKIIHKRHIRRIGWPTNIKFIPPSNLSCGDDVRFLLHALRTKKCRWVQLSADEVVDHMEDLQRRMDTGEVVGRKCKIRSDKDKKRQKNTYRKKGKVKPTSRHRKHLREVDDGASEVGNS